MSSKKSSVSILKTLKLLALRIGQIIRPVNVYRFAHEAFSTAPFTKITKGTTTPIATLMLNEMTDYIIEEFENNHRYPTPEDRHKIAVTVLTLSEFDVIGKASKDGGKTKNLSFISSANRDILLHHDRLISPFALPQTEADKEAIRILRKSYDQLTKLAEDSGDVKKPVEINQEEVVLWTDDTTSKS